MLLSPLVIVILLALLSFIMIVLAFWYILRLPSWMARRATLEARRWHRQEERSSRQVSSDNANKAKQAARVAVAASKKKDKGAAPMPATHPATPNPATPAAQKPTTRKPVMPSPLTEPTRSQPAGAPASTPATTFGRSSRRLNVVPTNPNYAALKEQRQGKNVAATSSQPSSRARKATASSPKREDKLHTQKISNDTFRGANAIKKPQNKLGKSVPKPKLLTRTFSESDHAQMAQKYKEMEKLEASFTAKD